MKKNKIILVLSVGLLLSPFALVKAVEAVPLVETTTIKTPTTNNANDILDEKAKIADLKARLVKETAAIKNNFETKQVEIEKKIAAKKDITKKKLEAKAQEKVRVTLEKIYNKLNSQIIKLSQVGIKISTKIFGFENDRRDVTDAKVQYNLAKIALEKATSDVLATRMVAVSQIAKETTKETLRDLVKTAEESIKNAGSEYRKVLPLLARLEELSNVVKKIPTTTSN